MRWAVLILMASAGCSSNSSNDASTPQPKGRSTSAENGRDSALPLQYEVTLWRKYKDNVVAADMQYTGKIVEFLARGKVEKDDAAKYYIAGHVVDGPSDQTVPGVQCYVSQESVGKLASAKGRLQGFKVRGKCLGKKNNSRAWGGFVVTVADCAVLQVLTWKGGKWVEVGEP